jgi:hypothetical protein
MVSKATEWRMASREASISTGSMVCSYASIRKAFMAACPGVAG